DQAQRLERRFHFSRQPDAELRIIFHFLAFARARRRSTDAAALFRNLGCHAIRGDSTLGSDYGCGCATNKSPVYLATNMRRPDAEKTGPTGARTPRAYTQSQARPRASSGTQRDVVESLGGAVRSPDPSPRSPGDARAHREESQPR